jgi:PBSX family phage terminase large subunit
MSGPAGTGKTLAWLAHCYKTAAKYPGARVLIVRKSRASLTDSVLVTFERDILGPNHPIFSRSRVARLNRSSYRLANGSEIVLGGMDKPDKVLSSEYDLIYVPEATDLEVTDWETLGGRLRSNAVPYQQIIGDCNPTSPQHWLYQRCQNGLTKLIPTTHRDNPAFWDSGKGDWTERGRIYLERLGRMTGARRARFLDGLWVQSEGLVFEGWDAGYHVIPRFEVPADWPRYLSIDWGYTNPFCCQFWAQDYDGRLYLTDEIYHTRKIVEDHCVEINRVLKTMPKPYLVVCDHDRGDRETFTRHCRLPTVAAIKGDNSGVQDTSERLKVQGDGLARLFCFEDTLTHPPDPNLLSESRPTRTIGEIPGYVWDPSAKKGERPINKNNHGCDAMRYMCRYLSDAGPRVTKEAVSAGEASKFAADLTRNNGWGDDSDGGSIFDRIPN